MELTEFVRHFAEQFDEIDDVEMSASTEFKKLDEWSSLTALSIIAMVDEVYSVVLNGEDIRTANTIGDIFDIVNGKI